jgi:hypothetical protein
MANPVPDCRSSSRSGEPCYGTPRLKFLSPGPGKPRWILGLKDGDSATVPYLLPEEPSRGGAMLVKDNRLWVAPKAHLGPLEKPPGKIDILSSSRGKSGVEKTDSLEDLAAKGRVGGQHIREEGTREPRLVGETPPARNELLSPGDRRVVHNLTFNAPNPFILEPADQFTRPPRTHHAVGIGEGQNLPSTGPDANIPG